MFLIQKTKSYEFELEFIKRDDFVLNHGGRDFNEYAEIIRYKPDGTLYYNGINDVGVHPAKYENLSELINDLMHMLLH